jgi:hypothetical protein
MFGKQSMDPAQTFRSVIKTAGPGVIFAHNWKTRTYDIGIARRHRVPR